MLGRFVHLFLDLAFLLVTGWTLVSLLFYSVLAAFGMLITGTIYFIYGSFEVSNDNIGLWVIVVGIFTLSIMFDFVGTLVRPMPNNAVTK